MRPLPAAIVEAVAGVRKPGDYRRNLVEIRGVEPLPARNENPRPHAALQPFPLDARRPLSLSVPQEPAQTAHSWQNFATRNPAKPRPPISFPKSTASPR
jgi:hypothetical protein